MVEERKRSRKKDIPDGQPRPHPRIILDKQKKTGRKLPIYVYPHEVINVRSKKSLDENLEHYSHPAPMFGGSPHPKNKYAMRYMVEWVFPALRWFCKVYNTPIPTWLKGNGWADGMSAEDYRKVFGGDHPLRVTEWKEDASRAGMRE